MRIKSEAKLKKRIKPEFKKSKTKRAKKKLMLMKQEKEEVSLRGRVGWLNRVKRFRLAPKNVLSHLFGFRHTFTPILPIHRSYIMLGHG